MTGTRNLADDPTWTMRKIILSLAASLDGFIEGPNREIDWIPNDPETAAELNAFAKKIDTVLYGRVSYELFGQYRPADDAPDDEKQFYDAVSRMKKYVFSTTKTEFSGDAILIQENIKDELIELKMRPGKDIWLFGGSKLITSLLNLDLIDCLELAIIPVILGSGTPMFKGITSRKPLVLLNTKTYNAGISWHSYEFGNTDTTESPAF
jgi:dihydrofolate reductase